MALMPPPLDPPRLEKSVALHPRKGCYIASDEIILDCAEISYVCVIKSTITVFLKGISEPAIINLPSDERAKSMFNLIRKIKIGDMAPMDT